MKPNFFIASEEEEVFAPTFAEQFECVMDALGEASVANGMTGEWIKFQPKFKAHIDSWKECSQLSDKLKVFLYVFM